MKRVKSAPANIAEMVNRKKPPSLSTASNLVLFCKTQTQYQKQTQKQKQTQTQTQKQKQTQTQTQDQDQKQTQENQQTILSKPKISLTPFKTQKNIEKTVHSVMLDYIGDKQVLDTNDEGVLLISIMYYTICEKTFTKKNLNEFMLFLIQTFIKYLFTHKLHNYYIDHSETINAKIAMLHHSIHIF
jgi:hypothetical protein